VRDADSARARLDAVFETATSGAAATRALGRALGARLAAGDVVLLEGGLGAGKTVFVQGLAEGLGLRGAVKSPTYTLVHEHHARAWPGARADLAHLDLYRIPEGRDPGELGLEELLERAVLAVEWGGRLAATYPAHVLVTLTGPDPALPPDARGVRVRGQGERPADLVRALASEARA